MTSPASLSPGGSDDISADTAPNAAHDAPALPPLRLLAADADDLRIVSAALQDSLIRPLDIRWDRRARTLTLTLDRFCWECGGSRVRAALQFGDVHTVSSRDLPRDPGAVLELLAMEFTASPVAEEAPGGAVVMLFAGGGDLRVAVECLDAVVTDLDQPRRKAAEPRHETDADGAAASPA